MATAAVALPSPLPVGSPSQTRRNSFNKTGAKVEPKQFSLFFPDEEDDEEPSEEEKAQREKILAEGAANAQATGTTVPSEIVSEYKHLNHIIRNFWKSQEVSKDEREQIAKVNDAIKSANRKEGRSENSYLYPETDITAHIRIFGELGSRRINTSGEEKKEIETKLLQEIKMYQHKLASWGLDWHYLISGPIQEDLNQLIKECNGGNEDLFEPTPEQEQILVKTAGPLKEIITQTADKAVGERNCAEIENINSELQKFNEDKGYAQDLCVLNTRRILEKLIPLSKAVDNDTCEKLFQKFQARVQTELIRIGYPLEKVLPGLDLHSLTLKKTLPAPTDPKPTETIADPKTVPTSAGTHPGPMDEDPKPAVTPKPAEAPKPIVTPQPMPRFTPEYTSGVITELGKIEAIQPLSDKAARVVLNSGTEMWPCLNLSPGSEVGRGVAHDLLKQDSNLRILPMPKDLKSSDIVGTGHVAMLPHSGSDRKPVTMIQLQLRPDEKHSERPLEIWATRTSYLGLVGKKKGEDKIIIKIKKHIEIEGYLTEMKRRKLHPDTKKPLTEEDRKQTPWLFNLKEAVREPEVKSFNGYGWP